VRRLILTFHGIGAPHAWIAPGEADFWVDVWDFERTLERIHGRDVLVTFDDGNASDAVLALPRLVDRGLRATFFIVLGHLGKPGYLDFEGVRELVRAGMQIGSHGHAHRDWRSLDDAELGVEIVGARDELEAIVGSRVVEASCPFGSYDRRVLRKLRSAGFRVIYTSDDGWASDRAWLRPRNTLRNGAAAADTERLLAAPSSIEGLVLSARRTLKRWR
jgi:peptidoglycan/xylan/chitin deacetylase (PgdA/CDA1 family)